MRRTLLWAAMIWIAGAGIANALVMKVKPQGEGGDVLLRVGMSNEDYKSAQDLMGGGNNVVDSEIPGMNDVNIAIPVPAAQWNRWRTNAANEAKNMGTTWCVMCDAGNVKFTVHAQDAFRAAVLGTSQCQEKTKSMNLSVPGKGSCALDGN